MHAIEQFCEKFGTRYNAPQDLVLRAIGRQLHLFTPAQATLIDAHQPVVGGGIFLGSVQKDDFTPSAQFIDIFLKDSENVVTLDEKTAWLYLCGRDVIEASGVQLMVPSHTHVIIKDKLGQILGYGVTANPKRARGVVVQNIYDKGIMLRREMTK